jgi:hypothetical protein
MLDYFTTLPLQDQTMFVLGGAHCIGWMMYSVIRIVQIRRDR